MYLYLEEICDINDEAGDDADGADSDVGGAGPGTGPGGLRPTRREHGETVLLSFILYN